MSRRRSTIQPYDWAGFLKKRITETGEPAPLQGFINNGYKLIYTEEPTPSFKQAETTGKRTDLSYSLGIALSNEGAVTGVTWDSPAFKAG
jgi:predicted metalloprotease with PDZ domain